MSNYLHIVCLDAPAPADYGGVIDMFYKIKALAEIGKRVILHYFNYHSVRNTEGLEDYCQEIHSYQRKPLISALPLFHPFIIQSRINEDLIKRLNEDDYPILLEGLHCAGIIPFITDQQRVVLRMHNDEASYYRHLAANESSLIKRIYFKQESKLLEKYQHKLNANIPLACLSESDIRVFKTVYNFTEVHFIPCFIAWQQLNSKNGFGTYCLYHGNMSVSENEQAAVWLIQSVFSKIKTPFIIAGKGISDRLKTLAEEFNHITLISDPTISEIDHLIHEAHINVLPSMNNTGVKLKLLNALLNGRHCITNSNGVKGSKIEKGLSVTDKPSEWIQLIGLLMKKDFATAEILERQEILSLYNNELNAKKLNELWSHYR